MTKQRHVRQGIQCAALATLALIVTHQIPQPLTATAKPNDDHRVKGCQNEDLLLPTHPDIEALRQLMNRYGRGSLAEAELGMTRVEFAYRLSQVAQTLEAQSTNDAGRQIRAADRAVLARLQQDYAKELAQVRDQGVQESERHHRHLRGRRLRQAPGLTSNGATFGQLAPPSAVRSIAGASAESRAQPRQFTPRTKSIPPAAGIIAKPAPEPFSDDLRAHPPGTFNTEEYNRINENPFRRPQQRPLSTFSIDVDTASYSNVRRFIRQGQLPPKDAVRLEEMINYFDYDYPQPKGDQPFSVTTEITSAPWQSQHKLVQIGLKGKQLQEKKPSNLVFLLDVSGSMRSANKLGLVKKSVCQLVRQLDSRDRVSIVVYAGQAGAVLQPTPGNQQDKIMAAIERLQAGGSTAGGAGIKLAYKLAREHFIEDGNNRVILATDGDFNVGVSSNAELERLIETKRDEGIFLTVLGFGTGNYKDAKMELLANKGNGNYAYLDNILEAQKVLVHDLRSTLFTIAKDVKIQVEFNPAKIQAYRLIGYENRLLRAEDFNDDRKDAGEIGAGHTVTALYEVIPTGINSGITLPTVDPLKYQQGNPAANDTSGDELMHVKLRYKTPRGSRSKLISQPIMDRPVALRKATDNLKFSSAVAMYGMMLRDSEWKGKASFGQILELAQQSQGKDPRGYRQAFIQLVERSRSLERPSD